MPGLLRELYPLVGELKEHVETIEALGYPVCLCSNHLPGGKTSAYYTLTGEFGDEVEVVFDTATGARLSSPFGDG